MQSLKNKIVVVAGGTGNVGSFIVKDLLQRNATVVVPSRSEQKITELVSHLSKPLADKKLDNLTTITGNIANEETAEELLGNITDSVGFPDAAISSLGNFVPAPSMLNASVDDIQQVVDGYLISHFVVARTFLKKIKERKKGTYIFINGPLALEPWEDSAAGLVSTVTAGQQMLFKTMAQELKESNIKVSELINYAYIRNRETQPGSNISGEATGAYASYLISDAAEDIHGKSIQLQSTEQLTEKGIETLGS